MHSVLCFETGEKNPCYYSQGSKEYLNKRATRIMLKKDEWQEQVTQNNP